MLNGIRAEVQQFAAGATALTGRGLSSDVRSRDVPGRFFLVSLVSIALAFGAIIEPVVGSLEGAFPIYFFALMFLLGYIFADNHGQTAFEGFASTRNSIWPRWLLLVSVSFLVVLFFVVVQAVHKEWSTLVPRLVVGILLLWFSFTVLFGTPFCGKFIPALVRNPIAPVVALFRSRDRGHS